MSSQFNPYFFENGIPSSEEDLETLLTVRPDSRPQMFECIEESLRQLERLAEDEDPGVMFRRLIKIADIQCTMLRLHSLPPIEVVFRILFDGKKIDSNRRTDYFSTHNLPEIYIKNDANSKEFNLDDVVICPRTQGQSLETHTPAEYFPVDPDDLPWDPRDPMLDD